MNTINDCILSQDNDWSSLITPWSRYSSDSLIGEVVTKNPNGQLVLETSTTVVIPALKIQ